MYIQWNLRFTNLLFTKTWHFQMKNNAKVYIFLYFELGFYKNLALTKRFWGFMGFCKCQVLLYMLFLLHAAFFIKLLLIYLSSFLLTFSESHIICFSHFLEGMVFRQDVVVSTETTFFQVFVDQFLVVI